MTELANEVVPVNIEDELKQSYLDYAMSVIVGRALPDVRDGLKPVHRRVLYAMHDLNNDWNKPHKKSARIVGEVVGKYHPHSDTAVYDTIVRLAQPFSMRNLVVDGQGNFGSVDGDSPAAMRYTEVRMSHYAHYLLADLEKDTVPFVPNYDETEFAPSVLPTRIPNLLVNGASGIAVGMATNIPTHNLGEIIDATVSLIDDPNITIEDLMKVVPGPDFPTAAIINGRAGIVSAYRTGRGRILIRSRTEIETNEKTGKQAIIVTELPYQVNKARLIEKIAELVKLKKIEGITALRDESDKDGIRVVIELRRNEVPEVILNKLYAYTQLQNVFGINMVALVDGEPKTLPFKRILDLFIRHRREVVTRRTVFELRKARARAHILEGLGIALANIDEMITLIKESPSPADAKAAMLARAWDVGQMRDLIERAGADASRPDDLDPRLGLKGDVYHLSEAQAQAILDLKLHRLTGLEQDKITGEYKKLLDEIAGLLTILGDDAELLSVIRAELLEVKSLFADARRTEIIASQADLTEADLITEEDVVVTLSHGGYVKYQPVSDYQAQRRGGRGKMAAQVKSEDFIYKLIVANTHDTVLCFSSSGKVYWLKVYQLPQAGRASRGRPIVNLLPLDPEERINAIMPLRAYDEAKYILMATALGTVKKVALTEFQRPRTSGIIALDLTEGDELVGVEKTTGEQDVFLFTNVGKVIRFAEDEVRAMGRTARGVRGIRLGADQRVISLVVGHTDGAILTATERGYGKRTQVDDHPRKGRGGQGVISIQTTERNGHVVSAIAVNSGDEVMLISDRGTLVRIPADEVSLVSRNTQGVKLINLSESESLVGVERVDDLQGENGDATDNNDTTASESE